MQAGSGGAAESENSQSVRYEALLRMQAAKSGGRSEWLPTYRSLRGSTLSRWWQVTDLNALGHTHSLSCMLQDPGYHGGSSSQVLCRSERFEPISLLRRVLQDAQVEHYVPTSSSWVSSMHSPVCCRFRLPDGLRLEHLEGLAQRHTDTTPKDTPFLKVFGSHVDDSQTWDFVAWMRSVTSLPIFVKVGDALAQDTDLPVQYNVVYQMSSSPKLLD